MFHARIVSPRGSLYLAAEATPYDLENLRSHVHDLWATAKASTQVELRIDRPSTDAAYQRVSAFLKQLEAEGIQTSLSLSPTRPTDDVTLGTLSFTRDRDDL